MAFEFRLARDLGCTVSELGERLTTAEFARWAGFYTWEAKEQKKAEDAAKKRRKGRPVGAEMEV